MYERLGVSLWVRRSGLPEPRADKSFGCCAPRGGLCEGGLNPKPFWIKLPLPASRVPWLFLTHPPTLIDMSLTGKALEFANDAGFDPREMKVQDSLRGSCSMQNSLRGSCKTQVSLRSS